MPRRRHASRPRPSPATQTDRNRLAWHFGMPGGMHCRRCACPGRRPGSWAGPRRQRRCSGEAACHRRARPAPTQQPPPAAERSQSLRTAHSSPGCAYALLCSCRERVQPSSFCKSSSRPGVPPTQQIGAARTSDRRGGSRREGSADRRQRHCAGQRREEQSAGGHVEARAPDTRELERSSVARGRRARTCERANVKHNVLSGGAELPKCVPACLLCGLGPARRASRPEDL